VGSNDYSGFQNVGTTVRALDGAMRYQIGFNHKF
jgi:hypothetical protein